MTLMNFAHMTDLSLVFPYPENRDQLIRRIALYLDLYPLNCMKVGLAY